MEGAIDDALKGLSAGGFQRLAEAYAEISWPGRYEGLVPRGRNPFTATTTGWPDAWVSSPDGGVEAVECTRGSGWLSHLEADVEKVGNHPRPVRSFVFVTGANQPQDEALTSAYASLESAGLSRDKIEFVFRQRLCRDLAAPRFARVRADLLKLPPSPSPFVPLDLARNLFADGSLGAFGPTKEEYSIHNRVWASKSLAPTREAMERQRWAYVEGHGASGKTVLCTKLGVEWIATVRPAYYLDLASAEEDASRIIEAMVTYGSHGVLFVVDNVHLAEGLVGQLFDNWDSRVDGSTLLLAGREVSSDPWSGTGDGLHDIRRQAIRVRPGSGDVFGTYRRLVARRFPAAELPPRFLTRRWANLFRGDLVAFAAAVVREHANGQPFGELSAEDAVDYVRETYLADFTGDEQRLDALLIVAALSVLEIPTPTSLVPPEMVKSSLESGVLLRDGGMLSAAHPGLARLLLVAAGREEIDVDGLLRSATGAPSLASPIAMRLFKRHELVAGAAICRLMAEREEWGALLPDSLDDLPRIAHIVKNTISWERLDELVVEGPDWATATPRTSLTRLVAVLELCGSRMPRCSAALGSVCFPGDRPADWLLDRFSASGPAAAARFAQATQRFHSSVVWPEGGEAARQQWVDEFAVKIAASGLDRATWGELKVECRDPAVADLLDRRLVSLGIDAWIGILSRMPAQRIAHLLKLRLPGLSALVTDAIEDDRLARAWIDGALATGGADELTRRVSRARRALPRFHRAVGEELARSGDEAAWVAQLLGLPAGTLSRKASRGLGNAISISRVSPEAAPFVERADQLLASPTVVAPLKRAIKVQSAESLGRALRAAPGSWPGLNERLVELSADPEVSSSLARELCNAPLSELRRMLVDHPLPAAVLDAVQPEMWMLGRPVLESASSYVNFPSVASGMSRLGYTELARPLANSLGEAILREDIPRDRLHLAHVSHLLRLIPADAHQLRQGLESHFSADGWAGDALLRIGAFAASQAVYSLWCNAPDFASAIPADALREKLRAEMRAEYPPAAICLLGSVSLILRRTGTSPPAWLDSKVASELLGWHRWQGLRLSPGAAQVLLGLRALEAAGADLNLNSSQLRQMLSRCRESAGRGQRHGEVADKLAVWLEQVLARGASL